MTRKEAIEIFKRLKENAPNEMHIETVGTAQELFEMAIQALSQEPCDDVVSRQAVLNAIEHEDKWLLAAKGHNGLTEIAFSGLKARVDALPSVTHKSDKYRKEAKRWKNKWLKSQKIGKWIPFSEKLPKPFEHCLITTTDGEVIYHYDDGHYSKYKAWMPLPKPYEPQERSK